jgi:catechol 2,3-dioxygenase-like lactoylglutathione lyase family enzyme
MADVPQADKDDKMIGRMYEIVIDCPDPKALADFYAEILGFDVIYADDDWVTVGQNEGVRLGFQRAPDHRPPRWPDPTYPQQMHIDVFVPDVEKAEPAVLELGATLLEGAGESSFRVYADPAGHPFCLCRDDPEAP